MKIIRIKSTICEGCGLPKNKCECEPCVWLGTREDCRGCPYREDCGYIAEGITGGSFTADDHRRRGQDDRASTLSA